MLRRQDRHMQHALQRDIRDEMAVASHEAAILTDASMGRNKAKA
jgi:hypothetical protein